MPDGKTFKENIAEEKQKLSGMNLKQKISYLKTYYLTAALIILAVIIAGVDRFHFECRSQNKRAGQSTCSFVLLFLGRDLT